MTPKCLHVHPGCQAEDTNFLSTWNYTFLEDYSFFLICLAGSWIIHGFWELSSEDHF